MEIRKVLNGRYQFVNNYRNTSNGFAHDTTLFNDTVEIGKYSCHYLNGTWEYYTYQTVMKNCISKIIEDRQKEFIKKCKQVKGIKRLVAKEKELILQHFEQLKEIKELRTIYKELDRVA